MYVSMFPLSLAYNSHISFLCPKTKWSLTKRMNIARLNFVLHISHPPVNCQLSELVEKSFLFDHCKMTFSPMSFRPIVIPHGSWHFLIVHFFRSEKGHRHSTNYSEQTLDCAVTSHSNSLSQINQRLKLSMSKDNRFTRAKEPRK